MSAYHLHLQFSRSLLSFPMKCEASLNIDGKDGSFPKRCFQPLAKFLKELRQKPRSALRSCRYGPKIGIAHVSMPQDSTCTRDHFQTRPRETRTPKLIMDNTDPSSSNQPNDHGHTYAQSSCHPQTHGGYLVEDKEQRRAVQCV